MAIVKLAPPSLLAFVAFQSIWLYPRDRAGERTARFHRKAKS
nr:hypothetical protein [Azospirillum sp. 412522]